MLFKPKCKECGRRCSSIEVILPNELPAEWPAWPQEHRDAFLRRRISSSHHLLYEGPGGGNGWSGDPISPAHAAAFLVAIVNPTPEAMKACGLYDSAGLCAKCGEFYCPEHWSISATGHGVCPRGHGKSLDPHWHA